MGELACKGLQAGATKHGLPGAPLLSRSTHGFLNVEGQPPVCGCKVAAGQVLVCSGAGAPHCAGDRHPSPCCVQKVTNQVCGRAEAIAYDGAPTPAQGPNQRSGA